MAEIVSTENEEVSIENLTIEQYAKILNRVMEKNSHRCKYLGKLTDKERNTRRFIKYVTAHFDTRDGSVYAVEMDEYMFTGTIEPLNDLIMRFLDSNKDDKSFDAYRKSK